MQERNSYSNTEQRFSELRVQLEEAKSRLREQERMIQSLMAANKRLETDSCLLREEMERME